MVQGQQAPGSLLAAPVSRRSHGAITGTVPRLPTAETPTGLAQLFTLSLRERLKAVALGACSLGTRARLHCS